MSGAILQGVPATTLDTDIWIDLPSRQYIRVLNLCRCLGATIRTNTGNESEIVRYCLHLVARELEQEERGSREPIPRSFLARSHGELNSEEHEQDRELSSASDSPTKEELDA